MVNMAARDATASAQEIAARNAKAATTALLEDATQAAVNVNLVQAGMSLMVLAAALVLQHGGENAAIGDKMLIAENVMILAEAIRILFVDKGVRTEHHHVNVQVAGNKPQALAAANNAEL